MTDIAKALHFAAQNLHFLSKDRINYRAGLVESDFAAIGLKYALASEKIPVPQFRGMFLPYSSYRLIGSECDINHAVTGDRKHTSMGGGGLDRECLLYFSKISEWAHASIPHLWPAKLRDELRDPNQHLNTLTEVWWLARCVGAEFAATRYCVPVDAAQTHGKNFDWQVKLSSGVTLNLEVKRRLSDMARVIDVPKFKWKTVFNDLAKFPPAAPPDRLNVGCIRLFGSISNDVRIAAKQWLEQNPSVSALAFHAPTPKDGESFAVIAQPGLGYIEHLLARPDHEDETYIAPFWFARDVPGLNLPRVTEVKSVS